MRSLFIRKIACICFSIHSVAFAIDTRMAFSDLIPDELQEYLYNDAVSLNKSFIAEITNLSIYKSGSLPIIEDFSADSLDICILALPEDREFPI